MADKGSSVKVYSFIHLWRILKQAYISSVEERELPEAVVDDIRSRLSCGDIIRSNLVCKGWAAVSETPYFLQLWRERLPCTSTTWGLEVQVRSASGQDGNFKVVNLKAFDSSKHSSRLVAADLQVPDLRRQHYNSITACCSADGLICLMGYHGQWFPYCRRIMVANPLTKEPLHVLPHPPLHCSWSDVHAWDHVMVADPGSEGHYKVLLASNEADHWPSYYNVRFTAIYSSRTGVWQARVHLRIHGEPTPCRLVAPIEDMVYMVHQVKSGTYGFVARNIHEALPDPEPDHQRWLPASFSYLPELPACSWGKTWPAASWKGVQIPRIVVRQDVEHTMKLLACLGRLLLVTVPDIFEFLPSEAGWVQAFTMPSGMEERFKAPEGSRYNYSDHSICQCFEQDGGVRFVNGANGVGIIFDVRANAWSVDPVGHGVHPYEDRCFALAFRPSLRPARGGSRTPLGDLLARRPRPPRDKGDRLLALLARRPAAQMMLAAMAFLPTSMMLASIAFKPVSTMLAAMAFSLAVTMLAAMAFLAGSKMLAAMFLLPASILAALAFLP